jgi:hypothetical protein
MATRVKGVTMTSIRGKYPNFDNEYHKGWRPICKKRLAALDGRKSNSSRLTGVTEECRQFFPYLTVDEMATVASAISDKFRYSLGLEDWDPWRSKLPKIFGGSEIDNGITVTLFETNSDGIPQKISTMPKNQTFTVSITSDRGDNVFKLSGVPKDITMTSISEITKSLA